MFARLVLLLVSAAAALAAQDSVTRRLDEIFRSCNGAATPGASAAVIKDGKLAWQKGYGTADLEYDVPITPDTIFHVASVSKQFTAMALVLLEQDRKLSLDDDVRKYLPELPDYGHRIAIRNLLQHTSGVRDQWQTLALAGWRLDDVITQKQILRMLFHQKELNFEPGTNYLYSNGGYTLAAEIVARVSGKALPEFCDERIFRPLGMTHTHFQDDHRRIVRNRAYSYESTGDGYRALPLNFANFGATSLFTTAPDLVKWLDNFREPKVGGPAAVARLEQPAVLASGRKIDYALGVGLGTYRGLRTISHSGIDAGYRSYVVWFPEQKTGIAVLSNLASFDPTEAADKIAAVYLEQEMTPELVKSKAARNAIAVEPGAFDPYAGTYRLNVGTLLDVVVKGGKLYASWPGGSPFELKPLASGRFFVDQSKGEVEFAPAPEGGMMMKITQGGWSAAGDRVTLEAFDSKDLADYPGAYWSDELETQYTIFLRGGELFADHAHHGEIALTPVAKDEFKGALWFMQEVKFIRDDAGHVKEMRVGGGRVTGVRFIRR